MADIDSNLPVRAAAGDVVVNVLTLAGATLDPASEGTSQLILAGITALEASSATAANQLTILAGITALDAGATGNAQESTSLAILAGVTGIEAIVATENTQKNVLAGVTALEALETSILAGVTGIKADLAVQLPAALGPTGSAASLSVVLAKDQAPIGVFITTEQSGTNVTQFKTDPTVATNNTSVNTYAPVSTFTLDRVHASGSGRIKVEVRKALVTGITGADALKWVAFNSTSEPNVDIDCSSYKVPAGEEVQVVVTNLEAGKAQDLYSTIVGDLL